MASLLTFTSPVYSESAVLCLLSTPRVKLHFSATFQGYHLSPGASIACDSIVAGQSFTDLPPLYLLSTGRKLFICFLLNWKGLS